VTDRRSSAIAPSTSRRVSAQAPNRRSGAALRESLEEDALKDALWLSDELGRSVGLREAEVCGEALHRLLAAWRR
jgi:hypothetical protein